MQQSTLLKQLRKKKNLTLMELSDATKISKSALARMESGERSGTIEALTSLAHFYGVSIDYITCNPERNELIDKLLETLIIEGVVDLDKPLTPEAENLILEAVNLKLKKLNIKK